MSGKMAVGGLRAGVEPFIEQLAAPTCGARGRKRFGCGGGNGGWIGEHGCNDVAR